MSERVEQWRKHNPDMIKRCEVEVVSRKHGQPQRIKLVPPPELDNYLPSTWYIEVPQLPFPIIPRNQDDNINIDLYSEDN